MDAKSATLANMIRSEPNGTEPTPNGAGNGCGLDEDYRLDMETAAIMAKARKLRQMMLSLKYWWRGMAKTNYRKQNRRRRFERR